MHLIKQHISLMTELAEVVQQLELSHEDPAAKHGIDFHELRI